MTHLSSQNRIFPLDFLKALSIIAVVSFHGIFIPESTYENSKYWVDVIFSPLRFCVPVLFTISFFLLRRSLDSGSVDSTLQLAKRRLARLLIPTLFWFSLASLLRQIGGAPVWLPLIQGRIFPGAYYLLVMILLMPIFLWVSSQLVRSRTFLIVLIAQCLVFWVVYLSIIHLPTSDFIQGLKLIARPLPAYWFVYMATGAFFYEHYTLLLRLSKNIPIWLKISTIVSTATLIFFEYGYLRQIMDEQPKPFEYSMFSCLLSVFSLFLCCVSVEPKNFPRWFVSIIQVISRYSLGIFCINGILSLVFLQVGTLIFQEIQLSLVSTILLRILGGALLIILSLWLSQLLEKAGLKTCVR